MTLTKIKLFDGQFDYFNRDAVQFVDVIYDVNDVPTHLEVYFLSSVVTNVALDDPTFSSLISTADANYTV